MSRRSLYLLSLAFLLFALLLAVGCQSNTERFEPDIQTTTREPPATELSADGIGVRVADAKRQARSALGRSLLARVESETEVITEATGSNSDRYIREVIQVRGPALWQPRMIFRNGTRESPCNYRIEAVLPIANTLSFYEQQLKDLTRRIEQATRDYQQASVAVTKGEALARLREAVSEHSNRRIVAGVLWRELNRPTRPDPMKRFSTSRSFQSIDAQFQRHLARPVEDPTIAARLLTFGLPQTTGIYVCPPVPRGGEEGWADSALLRNQIASQITSADPSSVDSEPDSIAWVYTGEYAIRDSRNTATIHYQLRDGRGNIAFERTVTIQDPNLSERQNQSPKFGGRARQTTLLVIFDEERSEVVGQANQCTLPIPGHDAIFRTPTQSETVVVGLLQEQFQEVGLRFIARDPCRPTGARSALEIGRLYNVDYVLRGTTRGVFQLQDYYGVEKLTAEAILQAELLDATTGETLVTADCPDERNRLCRGAQIGLGTRDEAMRSAIAKAARRMTKQSLIPAFEKVLQ